MFGRVTRVVALAAVVTHLWVSMVVAPWHHLVAHRLPAAGLSQPAEFQSTEFQSTEVEQAVVGSRCKCRHHAPRHQIPTCDLPAAPSSEPSSPAVPDHHEDCPVCQVLAQPFHAMEIAAPIVALERIEFPPPVSAVQQWLGAWIEPVSRGPPAA